MWYLYTYIITEFTLKHSSFQFKASISIKGFPKTSDVIEGVTRGEHYFEKKNILEGMYVINDLDGHILDLFR